MSLADKPCLANRVMSLSRFANGGGRFWFAVVRLAFLASLLPSGTVHVGPPNYLNMSSNLLVFSYKYEHLISKEISYLSYSVYICRVS